MSRRITLSLISLTVLFICATAGAQPLTAELTHNQEPTQGTFVTSTGGPRPLSFGTATFTLAPDNSFLTFTATINNIDVTGTQTPLDSNDNLVAAHIHAGTPKGENAGV